MKKFLIAILALLTIAVIGGLVFFYGLGYYLSPQSDLKKSDAVVAISGGETTSRAQEAIRLYKAGWASHIIFSGAASDPNSPSNAETMRRIAVSEGVPSNAIFLDEKSVDTLQNAAAVADIIRTQHYHQIILVTSPYHQRRASVSFDRASPNAVILNHSTTDRAWRRSHWWATNYSRELTFSELQKVIYLLGTKDTTH